MCHITVCDSNMYGKNCSMPCGHCLESSQCNNINGTCINGCDSGYQGSICNEGKLCTDVAVQSNWKVPIHTYNYLYKIFQFIQNVKKIILDQTVKKSAIVLAKVATEQQEHVTLGVIRDGKDCFVTKVCLIKTMFVIARDLIAIYFWYWWKTIHFVFKNKRSQAIYHLKQKIRLEIRLKIGKHIFFYKSKIMKLIIIEQL